ncbi:hypothetical protein HX802_04275 [Marine Group I thaumarchaeote]|uniref:Uncharacterized protein n=1 Tax=Marine Group I thaumarchaeote TaxID=2511932 RepID=A0A7K4NF25_9ARCH|nr:hypothetical protein [Marine Group I thaumarchaeote]
MKKFAIMLLGVIFVVLLSGSVESVSADHLLPGEGVFKNENDVNIASSIDSKYQIHLHVIVRNAQNQLVGVSQAVWGYYIPHQITDQIFDEMSGKREIVTVDKMKYEKIQNAFYDIGVQEFPFKTSYQDIRITWYLGFDENIDGHGSKRLPIFQAALSPVSLAEDDILTFHWTFLRVMN